MKARTVFLLQKDYLTFVGLSDDPNDVVIADNRGNNQGASGNYNSATVVSNCTGLTLKEYIYLQLL